MFIVIEGADASGKETQSRRLTARLHGVRYAFPQYDVAPLGPLIKAHLQKGDLDPHVLQSLLTVDKFDAAEGIRETLQRQHVVCDRWWPSAYVYGASDGCDKRWLRSIHATLPEPDLLLYLAVSLEEAKRRKPRPDDHYEANAEKQAQVRAGYRKLWDQNNSDKWQVIDGHGTPDEVADRIWAVVSAYMSDTRGDVKIMLSTLGDLGRGRRAQLLDMIPDPEKWSPPGTRIGSGLRDMIQGGPVDKEVILAVRSSEEVVGIVMAIGDYLSIFVHEGHRRKRIGTRLVEAARERAVMKLRFLGQSTSPGAVDFWKSPRVAASVDLDEATLAFGDAMDLDVLTALRKIPRQQ